MNVIALPARTIPKISMRRLMQARGTFIYNFDDLGLEIESSGFSAGSFEGTAEVSYFDDEGNLSWFVNDITLRCSKRNGKSWDVKHITLEQDDRLYIAIWSQLTDGNYKDDIQAKVEGQL